MVNPGAIIKLQGGSFQSYTKVNPQSKYGVDLGGKPWDLNKIVGNKYEI